MGGVMQRREKSFPGLAIVALVTLAVAGACDNATVPGSEVAEIGLPVEIAVNDNESITLPLTVTDRNGNPVDAQLTWESADPSVATVVNGVVTGHSPGYTTITVSARRIQRTNNVAVRQVPTEFEYVSGNDQATAPRGALPEPVVVRMLDRHGEPVAGMPVDFRVIEGGGTVSPAKTITDVDGYARATWRLGFRGVQRLEGEARLAAEYPALQNGKVAFSAAVAGLAPPPSVGGPSSNPEADPPAPVGDLELTTTAPGSVTLRWSAVNDGNGGGASYAIRSGPPGFKWEDAAATERIVTPDTRVGEPVEYTYAGLDAATEYEFQLVSFRDLLPTWLYGARSNRVYVTPREQTTNGGNGANTGNNGNGGGSTAAPSLGTLSVSPGSVTIQGIGVTRNLSAAARSASGTSISNAGVTWKSLNTGIATVSSTGRVTSKAVGVALIVASATCCTPDTVEVRVTRGNTPSNPNTPQAPSTPADPVPDAPAAAPPAPTPAAPTPSGSATLVNECASPKAGWIFCDDFDANRLNQYFEYDNANGSFIRQTNVGVNGSGAMKAQFAAGQQNAGSLKLAFGRTPDSYFRSVAGSSTNYREVYWRVYVMNEAGWTGGGGDKLSRGVVFAGSNWSEAAVGHVWSGGPSHNYLALDPASGTSTNGSVQTRRYNDFDNMRWLGARTGTTPLFSSANAGKWRCVETRMRLNDAGRSNGTFELWVDGKLETQATNLNWVGSYNGYGINALFLENFWNAGSPRAQARYFDNLVVSTQPIGCGNTPAPTPSNPAPQTSSPQTPSPQPSAPAPVVVSSVRLSPSSVNLTVGTTRSLAASALDSNGSAVTGKTFTWASSNSSVATVSNSGVVTARRAGTATITATSDGRSSTSTVLVTAVAAADPTPPAVVPEPPSTGGLTPPPAATKGAYIVEDFSSYSSTSQFVSDPRGIYNRVEDQRTDRMSIDNTVGYGGSNRSLRYDYPGGMALEYTITRQLRVPAGTKEVWVEAVVRFQPGFTFDTGGGMKLLHVNVFPDGIGRFGINIENGNGGTINAEGPVDNYNAFYLRGPSSNSLRSGGDWHVIRFHVNLAGTKTHRFWFDGNYVGSQTASTSANQVTGISLARNMNRTGSDPQSLWWGRVAVWTENPGW